MPRPKRIGPKRAPDAPATASSAAPLSAIPAHISSPKSQRSQTTSDDSDGLVTKKSGVAKKRNPLYRMSGAAAPDEVIQDGKRLKPIRGQERKDLNRIAREDDASRRAIDTLRRRMQEEEAGEKASKQGFQQQTTVRPTTSTKAAPPATLQVQRSQPDPDHEVESAPTAVPGSAWKKRTSTIPMSARKPMSTPRAEASMMALHNFQRRKRAPSILGIGDNEDETASISSGGSFGDLEVDDESTPLQSRRPQALTAPRTVSPPSFDNAEPRTTSSRKRKRGSSELRVPNSQPDDDIAAPPQSSPAKAIDDTSDEPVSSDESLPELPTEQPRDSSHTPSSTMAPPESSSPTKPASQAVTRRSPSPLQARQSRKNAVTDQGLAKTWNRSRAAKKPAKVPDTAMLQGLLPRRRQRGQDNEFSIWSTDAPGGTSDDDELSFAPSGKRAKGDGSRQMLGSKKTPATNARSGKKSSKVTAKGVTPLSKSRGSRTYSRRQSDKENSTTLSGDEHDETSVDVDDSVEIEGQVKRNSPTKPTQKLKAMAQKFAEVDTWEMEYEEVTGSSDTFKNAR